MPIFYFHVCNGTGFVEDEDGQELPGMEAARALALVSARDIMAADVRAGELDLASFIEVEDENRQWLFTRVPRRRGPEGAGAPTPRRRRHQAHRALGNADAVEG